MEIFIIICLILLNGIFSMSEIALVSVRRFKLENAAKKGNTNARRALDLSNNPNTFLSTVQIGITLIGIENFRTGNVWKWFMKNPEPRRGLQRSMIR